MSAIDLTASPPTREQNLLAQQALRQRLQRLRHLTWALSLLAVVAALCGSATIEAGDPSLALLTLVFGALAALFGGGTSDAGGRSVASPVAAATTMVLIWGALLLSAPLQPHSQTAAVDFFLAMGGTLVAVLVSLTPTGVLGNRAARLAATISDLDELPEAAEQCEAVVAAAEALPACSAYVAAVGATGRLLTQGEAQAILAAHAGEATRQAELQRQAARQVACAKLRSGADLHALSAPPAGSAPPQPS